MSAAVFFILIPGSCSPPSFFNKVVELLTNAGHSADAIAHKSVNDGKGPVYSMYDDADAIRLAIASRADQGQSVILAMNSYGGIPGTEAVKGLSRVAREAKGQKGGLIALVYLSSFLAEEGQTINEIMEGRMPPSTQTPTAYLTLDPKTDAEYIFSHLEDSDKAKYAAQFGKHSSRTFSDPLTYAGYLDLPITYLLCTDDLIVPPELQREMIDRAKAKGADVNVAELFSDHVPMLSHPAEVAEVLLNAAHRYRG